MALHPSDITIGNGEVVAVVGANGSGKSTLAALVAGLSRPETGTVVGVDDPRPLHRRPAHSLVQLTGTVFQDPEHQFLRSTVRAELMLAPRRLGWSAARSVARADELLQRLRLSRLAGANPFTLSGGEKRRLSVATALAVAPRLLVLDEPTFGQDAATWTELLDLLASIRADGGGQLVVSHDGPFVAALADRSLRMTDGRLAVAELVG
jgi:energy-coupling factor transport system ATP-binding protein